MIKLIISIFFLLTAPAIAGETHMKNQIEHAIFSDVTMATIFLKEHQGKIIEIKDVNGTIYYMVNYEVILVTNED